MEQVDQKKSLSQQLHDKASKISIGYDIEAHDKHYALLFLGPSLLILSVFVFYPMIKTVWMSFFLTNSLGKPTVFVGLQNYIDLFTSSAYLNSMKATFIYVLFVSILTIALGLLLAQTASAKLKGIGFFRTAFSSTMGVSVSVAAIFWLFIFNPSVGLLNKIAEFLHLPVVNWLMNLGFTFLILFGALQSVPVTLYEAARIAGVSKRYQFFKITIPMISPTLFFAAIITLIDAFKSFGLIDMMTAGGPNNTTNLLVYRIYQDAFLNGNYALASTESVVLAIIIAIFTLIQFKFLEKKVTY